MFTTMKHILNIFTIIASLLLAISVTSCQELTEPTNLSPTITTGEATSIGITSAVITGSSSSSTGNYYFLLAKHGESLESGTARQISIDDRSSDANSFYSQVNDLEPGTQYDYVLCATDDFHQEAKGNVMTFTTLSYAMITSVTYTDWDGNTRTAGEGLSPLSVNVYCNNGQVYHNVPLTYNGSDWEFGEDIDLLTIDSLVAIAPYNYDMYDNNYSNDYIYLNENPDLMFGWQTVNGSVDNLNIHLNRVMADVTFNIQLADDNPEDTVSFSSLALNAPNIAASASIDFNTKAITLSNDYYDSFRYYNNSFSIVKNSPTAINFRCLPTMSGTSQSGQYVAFDNQNILLYFLGSQSSSYYDAMVRTLDLGDDGLQAGHQYQYDITFHKTYISVDTVRVTPWVQEQGDDIIIRDIH